MRQPAAADNIIDSFNIIIISTNVVNLIVNIVFKSKIILVLHSQRDPTTNTCASTDEITTNDATELQS